MLKYIHMWVAAGIASVAVPWWQFSTSLYGVYLQSNNPIMFPTHVAWMITNFPSPRVLMSSCTLAFSNRLLLLRSKIKIDFLHRVLYLFLELWLWVWVRIIITIPDLPIYFQFVWHLNAGLCCVHIQHQFIACCEQFFICMWFSCWFATSSNG